MTSVASSHASGTSAGRNSWTVVLVIPTLLKARRLGMTAGDAATVATVSLVGVAVGAVLVGPLADRFGRRLLLIASVVASVFTLLVPPATSVGMFAALRLIAGAGLGACRSAVSLTFWSWACARPSTRAANRATATGSWQPS